MHSQPTATNPEHAITRPVAQQHLRSNYSVLYVFRKPAS